MKIAFLNIYQGKVYRGAETFISELSKRLSKNNDVDVLTSIGKLFRKKYDVIVPTNGRFQAILVRKIAWLTGAKVVISGQSGLGFDDRLNLYTFPNVFVALTSFQERWAKAVNPFIKVVTIPNGVDTSIFKPLNFKGKYNTVLSVGAFTQEKHHDLTIRAVSKLSEVKLIVVGGGGDQKQKIVDYGLKILGKERFSANSIPFEKMPDIYKEASVFAFPTVPWESFGIAMLEAMATNLPVVANDDPIRREIVGDAGLFVDPADIDAYAGAIKLALGKDWGDKPRKQAEKFSWDIIAGKYEELIKNLVKKD